VFKLKIASLMLFIIALFTLNACSTPAIPHTLSDRSDCLSCHASNAQNPYPSGHAKKGYPNNKCTDCHKASATTPN
jgi:hypothetical protein